VSMGASVAVAAPSAYAYVPTRAQIEAARVTRLMGRVGVASIGALRERSAAEPEWFWAAVIDDLEIPFAREPTAILDDSGGAEWARWFVGGEINIASACVDRWARDPRDDPGDLSSAENPEAVEQIRAQLCEPPPG
jgi:acetyl-CoA synthetase